MQLRTAGLTLTVFAMFAGFCSSQTSPTPESGTGIEGVITLGPAHPGPVRPGIADSAPLANTAFTVENDKGSVASFTTDDQGRFKVSLASGHYTVSLKEKKSGVGRYGPFDVDVVVGQMTKVEWQCDTGMR